MRAMVALYRSSEWTANTWQPFCTEEGNGLSDFGRAPPKKKKKQCEFWFKPAHCLRRRYRLFFFSFYFWLWSSFVQRSLNIWVTLAEKCRMNNPMVWLKSTQGLSRKFHQLSKTVGVILVEDDQGSILWTWLQLVQRIQRSRFKIYLFLALTVILGSGSEQFKQFW